jgi:hypothetical protein
VGWREAAFLSSPSTFLDRRAGTGAGRCGGGGDLPGVSGVSLLHAQLIPLENPNANLERISKSGVRYQSVLKGLHKLIPPDELEQRHAVSRTDGYWPFVRTGETPPIQNTYGEFDFYFFAELLDRAWEHYCDSPSPSQDKDTASISEGVWKNQVFIDVGSGAGRLVLAAAALHPTGWKQCRGVELLPGLHQAACENLDKCRLGSDSLALLVSRDDNNSNSNDTSEFLSLAPIDFTCSSFEDPVIDSHWNDASCIFVTASCLPSELLQSLSDVVGRQCRPGTIVMSTDYPLPLQASSEDGGVSSFRLELVEQVDGYSWVTGGDSTAYIQRVVESS